MKGEIKELLDVDFFAEKQMEMSLEKRKEMSNRQMGLQIFIRKNLLKKGKISKTTFNRWAKGSYAMFGYLVHEIMMPSEFNEEMGVKPINMKYYRNACKKVKAELIKLDSLKV